MNTSALLFSFASAFLLFSATGKKRLLYRETFEGSFQSTSPDLSVVNCDKEGPKCLQARHIPTSRGSARLGFRRFFKPVRLATLTYFLRFEPGFDFSRGGKLPGLYGGRSRTSGCVQPQPADSWSVRMMWRRNGMPTLYMYHQGRTERGTRCGIYYRAKNSRFSVGVWHKIKVEVRVNSRADEADGRVKMFIDGKKLLDVQQLRLRGTNNDGSMVSSFVFSNFYGGSDASWAPSHTTFIRFDDFKVKGK